MPYRILIADDALSVRERELPMPLQTPKMAVQAFLDEFSIKYGVSETELSEVIYCESKFDQDAIGDHGLAHNVAQFHEETFKRWSKQLGEELDWNSAHDQIKVMAWAFSQGHQSSWTCSRIVGLLK